MRRLLIVCVGVVLVYGGSAFGGEPKWVCAPEITPPGWYQQLVHKEKVAVGFDDFSVVDGTILALAGTGVFLQVRRADGSVAEVNNTAFGEGFSTNGERCLFKDYYVELGESRSPWHPTFVVKPDAGGLDVAEVSPSSWLLRQRLYDQVWLQQAIDADARGEKRPPEEPVSRRFPRTVLFYFAGQSIESYAVAEGHLVALSATQGRSFVTCFDLQSGQMLWSREIAEVTGLWGWYGLRVTGGVVNLVFFVPDPKRVDSAHVALDLNTGSLLRREPMIDLHTVPRLVRERGGRRLLLLREGILREYRGYLKLLEEDASTEVWSVRPPEWREFKLEVAQGNGEVFVPFRKGKWLALPEGVSAPENWLPDEPWVPEAQRDPLTHGVMCYDLSDGRLKATYGLDYKHLSDAPRDAVPDGVYWANYLAQLEGPPIITEDLVILSPLELIWQDARAWAVAVFARKSGQLLDVLWTPVMVGTARAGFTDTRKMEVHGSELLLLTKDARLCCFELPNPHPEPDAGE